MPASSIEAPDPATHGIVLFDVLDQATQLAAGRQLLKLGPFVVGSSGINYAIVQALIAEGSLDPLVSFTPLDAVDRIIAVSGSCSPTTARQIRHAMAHGYIGLAADPATLASPDGEAETKRLTAEAIRSLQQGHSVLVYTALEPETLKSAALEAIPDSRHRIGQSLGRIARDAVATCGLKRAIIAGGDTSSHALGQLDIFALTTRFPLRMSPGSPLCRAHSSNPALDGIEIAMKGGQVGHDDYFSLLRDGA